ncbi:MAG: hypothetical protein ACP5OG_02475 [Candidatus Nanoarchaeia archaeon]
MITKKEVAWIIISAFLMSIALGIYLEGEKVKLKISLTIILTCLAIIFVNIASKKIAARFFNLEIEHEALDFQRYGVYLRSYFKKPIPIGLILPFLSFFSLGFIKPLTILQFKSKNIAKSRVLRKSGAHRYSEINESDPAFTTAWGFWALIALSIIGSIFSLEELAKYSIYYGIWNLIPLGKLDGTKLFFGSLFNWCLLVIAYIFALVLVLI